MARVLLLACGIALMIVAIQGAAVPAELQTPGKAARTACIEETGVMNEALEKAAIGEFQDDPKLKCYFKCIFDKFEVISDNTIDFDAMLKLVPESIKDAGNNMIQSCRGETGTDLCDTAFNVNKCFFKVQPKEYFVI